MKYLDSKVQPLSRTVARLVSGGTFTTYSTLWVRATACVRYEYNKQRNFHHLLDTMVEGHCVRYEYNKRMDFYHLFDTMVEGHCVRNEYSKRMNFCRLFDTMVEGH